MGRQFSEGMDSAGPVANPLPYLIALSLVSFNLAAAEQGDEAAELEKTDGDGEGD